MPQDEKHKIKIEFSDNTVQIWSVHPSDEAAQLHRQVLQMVKYARVPTTPCKAYLIYNRVHTVMKSHEKSWNLKMYFPGLEKSWILRKMAEVMEKSWNFIFWSKDFMLFENWKNSPSHRAKICPQKAGFSAFLSHEKFKLVMKSHGKVIEFYCPISV